MRRLKITFNSPVVLTFTGICLAATFAGVMTRQWATQMLFSVWHSSLKDPLTYLRFFTHVFGHSGWEHFLGNASYLLLLGPMLEEKYGGKKIVRVMVITAIVTGLVNYILFPKTALCGASGIVFAFILLASFASAGRGEIPLTFILVAALFIGQQIYTGIASADNVSQLTHIIGGVIGAAFGFRSGRH